ncbi:MAG: ThiF family adenylyltransferase [Nitrososphaerota archaeon]|nr:ThiF family adenylyltransferase [Nitrososphaerota archaeon]
MGKASTGEMDDLYKSIFSSNLVFFSEPEQERLRGSTIAIAGMGGVGGLLAERLIRLGIGQLKILDPENFEQSNLNRQFGSSMLNLGQNKAEAVFRQTKDINPLARIQYSKSSLKTKDEADLFVTGCDLVIDEMDFGSFRESIFLQRASRQKGIYYMFAVDIGFGATVVIFDPNGLTLEEYDKLPPDINLQDIQGLQVPLERICPVMPSYAAPASDEANKILCEVLAGDRPAPTNSIGVGLASILAAIEAVNILLKKRDIVSAPQYTYIDLIDRKFLVNNIS